MLWFGYEHVADFIIVSPFTDPQSIERAKNFDHVVVTPQPVEAESYTEAMEKIIIILREEGYKQ